MQQPIQTAKVNERTIIREVLHHPDNDLTFFEILKQGTALFLHLLLNDGSPGDDHVVTTLVKLNDLKLQFPVLEICRICNRSDVGQRARKERAHLVQRHGEASLHLAGEEACHDRFAFKRHLESFPGLRTPGTFPGESGISKAIFNGLNRYLDEITDLYRDGSVRIAELGCRNFGLRLQAGVNNNIVSVYIYDFRRDDGASLHDCAFQAFFKELFKGF